MKYEDGTKGISTMRALPTMSCVGVKNTEVLMAAEEPEPARAKSEEGFLAVDGSCAESIFGGRTGTMTPELKEYQR